MVQRKGLRLLSLGLALLVWQIAAVLVKNSLLLVGPWEVARRLCQLVTESAFWPAIRFSFCRITLGFFLGFGVSLLLAVLAARFPVAEILLAPYMTAVKTVPVASFIVMALLWLSGQRINVFISFLMVLPVLYSNFLQGLRAADPQLKEMARVFRMSLLNQVRGIYAPALQPYCLSACQSALGLCWKAGVAAEVIGVCSGSMGGMLYDAKIYLELDSLFAWTAVIVAVSVCFERLFLRLLSALFHRMEGCV